MSGSIRLYSWEFLDCHFTTISPATLRFIKALPVLTVLVVLSLSDASIVALSSIVMF